VHWRRCRRARDLLAPIYGWFTEGFGTSDLKEAKVATGRTEVIARLLRCEVCDPGYRGAPGQTATIGPSPCSASLTQWRQGVLGSHALLANG